MAVLLCTVCCQHTAEYTCPRCNARYCSLDCYKQHSVRCTEGFYRDAVVSELHSITAGEDERQHMLEILQRLHQQDLNGGSADSHEDDEDDEDRDKEGELSSATLHRLLAKMQASGGVLDVSAEDLTPAELAAFHRALAAGALSSVVEPWQPWWLSGEAARLELSGSGTWLMVALGEEEQEQRPASGSSAAAAARPEATADGGTMLPAPPSRPLPPLAALIKAAPSPLLRYQLLDLLYAYCHTLRLYNGDCQCDAEAAADALFALSAVLAAVAASASGGSSDDSSSSSSDGVAPVLLGCVQRACQPPVGTRDSRGFAIGVLSDVAAMVQLGRPVVLTALVDLSRLLEAARQQLKGAGGQGDSRSKQQQKELCRRLVAAQRKILFFLAWANEQPPEVLNLLALAVAEQLQQHAAAATAPGNRREGVQPGGGAQSGSVKCSTGATPATRAVLIEEL